MPHQNQHTSDITFIGSGISTSYTILPFLADLKKQDFKQPLRITFIEKHTEFHTGLAYGSRSGSSALLITSLEDFLPVGDERDDFIQWLSSHKDALIDELRQHGGRLSANWIDTHQKEIEADQWEQLYIPRRFFGRYINAKVNKAINDFKDDHDLDVYYIVDRVTSIEPTNSEYRVTCHYKELDIISKHVIVSIGIPPVNQLWSKEIENDMSQTVCLISDPYKAGFTKNLKRVKNFVTTRTGKSDVLIIGANASAMEMIYKLNDVRTIRSNIGNVTVVSPLGELPNSARLDPDQIVDFVPHHLLDLADATSLTALQIYEAAIKDLDRAEAEGLGTSITEVPVSKAFIALLDKLNEDELREFACHYGNNIGKRQRRAGNHYTDVVDTLKSEGRLDIVSGYFHSIDKAEDNKSVTFNYQKHRQGDLISSSTHHHIVINCIGSKTLDNESVSPLIDDLMQKNLCEPNDSMRGFKVNASFECAPNLYIMGPLLAGNIINNAPLWHIEHCGRIISLGKLLAKSLAEKLNS